MLGQERIEEIIASSDMNLIDINLEDQIVIGDKRYSLSNHLENVYQVVLDRKLPEQNGNDIAFFYPDVISYTDYMPFGMEIESKSETSDYDFGFNGMYKDDEIKGEGNSYDFGARMYDPRVGRWLSRDPRAHDYVPLSPYHFGLNNPIYFIDTDGEVIIDANGNEVTVKYDDQGNVSGFNDDIAPQTKELLGYYLKSEVGMTQLQKMDETVTEIEIVESEMAAFSYEVDENGKESYVLVLGHTETKGNAKEKDGTKTAKKATITIFNGSIDLLLGETKFDEKDKYFIFDGNYAGEDKGKNLEGEIIISYDNPGPAQKAMMGNKEYTKESTLVHESVHTEAENIEIDRNTDDSFAKEAPAYEKEKELYNERKDDL